MTLGLPEHLARESLSRALGRAGHWAAAVCLGAALLLAVAGAIAAATASTAGPERQWAALIAALLIAVQSLTLYLVARYATVTLTLLALVAGSSAVFGLTVLIPASGETTLIALARAALVLIGGAGIGSGIAITWAVLGWALGEAAAFLGAATVGAATAGTAWAPSLPAAMTLGIVIIARTFDAVSRQVVDRRETALHRASQQTRELAIRHDYELRAIARLHDTALSHLVAIATAGSGPVDDRLRTAIRQDLTLIVGRDWAVDAAADATTTAAAGGRPGLTAPPASGQGPPPLADALALARDSGLAVRLTGDPQVLHLLGASRRAAVEAAATQCLVNVVRHAGVDEAEVAVGSSDGEITVVVVDGGAGFEVDDVSDDRIGLRTSIRGRIEQEGGTVRIWSRPGVGTTVVLSVPVDGA